MRLTTATLCLFLILVFVLGLTLGFTAYRFWPEEEKKLPMDLERQLMRLKFVNRGSNVTLKDYRILGATFGTYEAGGTMFETYVLGFEDRPGGASADVDYQDLIVKTKRSVGNTKFVIRIAQLGLDMIDVYLDDKYIGSARPSIELEVKF